MDEQPSLTATATLWHLRTAIRGVLLPATMKLLGDWNWYLPQRLTWLPRLVPEPQLPGRPQPEGSRA